MKAYKKQIEVAKRPPAQVQQKQDVPKVISPNKEARINFMQNIVRNSRVNA